ncbi:hypothetical protein GCM10008024_11890 [Allgaiera indica]|uniref:Uncharacterized protein n=1 Tax=Allgaiera indica TaxID=765699 RepID=A0AAN4UQ36_9RHOB|nr:hypothetical protein GCM10008024_11890 [Allgaiera indica]
MFTVSAWATETPDSAIAETAAVASRIFFFDIVDITSILRFRRRNIRASMLPQPATGCPGSGSMAGPRRIGAKLPVPRGRTRQVPAVRREIVP